MHFVHATYLHSNRKKNYQLVDPHYQRLGGRFGSCLAVGRGKNDNYHFSTTTTNLVVAQFGSEMVLEPISNY